MADFKSALARTLRFEGGYSNDPDDRGGETYRGISRKNWPAWEGWVTIGNLRLAGLSLDANPQLQKNVEDFYRKYFWTPLRCDDLPDAIGAELFDCAVNCGAGSAAKMLQRTVGANPDGAMGPDTLRLIAAAVEARGIQAIVAGMKEQRRDRYRQIATNDPTQGKFLKGWLNRVDQA